jgi:hypothetical protein
VCGWWSLDGGRLPGLLRTKSEYMVLFDLLMAHVPPAATAELRLLDEAGRPTAAARVLERLSAARTAARAEEDGGHCPLCSDATRQRPRAVEASQADDAACGRWLPGDDGATAPGSLESIGARFWSTRLQDTGHGGVMETDRAGGGLDEPGSAGTTSAQMMPGAVHALFQQRIAGDDALLKLAGLRFAQMGIAAEVYADTPDQLEYVLRFVPAHARLPVVHLNRGVNVLHERGRSAVREFADRFAGRIAGVVVHDQREMEAHTDRMLEGMRELDARLRERPDGPIVFLEYAAGLDLGWFIQMAEQLQDAERISFCIDVGHIGIKQASGRFWLRHPGLGLGHLTTGDYRLPDLVADVQDAVAGALPDVLDVIHSLGRIGKPLHFHLHDGHPLIQGLPDHFSFLTRLPIPFTYRDRQSLSTMYGPDGLAAIVSAAIEASPAQAVSFTVEVHQVEGRLPLGDAAWLFRHWRDTTNAERMNYWLSVLSDNAMLISRTPSSRLASPSPSRPPGDLPEGFASLFTLRQSFAITARSWSPRGLGAARKRMGSLVGACL